jgi:hypothetical protein
MATAEGGKRCAGFGDAILVFDVRWQSLRVHFAR